MNEKQSKLSIHIEQPHGCGQDIVQVIRIDEADFSITQPPVLLPLDFPSPWKPLEFEKAKITFTGQYGGLELSGIQLKDHQFVCVKCGKDILFPECEGAEEA